MLRFFCYFPSEGALIVRSERVAKYLHFASSVKPRNGLHEMRGRMITEVRGDIANSQSTTAVEQSLRMSVRGAF